MPETLLHWYNLLPRWIIGCAVFALILVVTHAIQSVAVWILNRRSRTWPPILQHVFAQTEKVARFAFVLFAAAVALPLIPIPHTINDVIRKVFGAAVIVLIGWIAMIAGNTAIDRYAGRFELDVADNLAARKAITQARFFKRALNLAIATVTAALALMTFESVRQFGVSLFASAGVAGIVVGLAAQPLLGNLLAGMQIAMTQPIRIDDAVTIDGEFGFVEEITSTYVVVRLWDWRRQVLPLTYFLQKPFLNWTRSGSAVLGSAKVYLDYAAPLDRIRAKAAEIVQKSELWDRNIVKVQVTDATASVIEVRTLFSATSAGASSDLAAVLREQLIAFVQKEFPEALPRQRTETVGAGEQTAGQ
ncbi:MAG: mechanosensitive ion channel family protein [Alphaproteobacteria bacterium]|jgi:small-conductance mechanosensitive channel|nr:mechanosensitive ion channel family protein [Alphaproteobacteria bacterium]